MKKSMVLALLALVLMSCGTGNDRLLTSATGSIYECLVVSPAPLKAPVCDTMSADMYGLPQMEPYFTVTHVLPSQFDDFLKSTRNVLILDIDEHKYTQIKTTRTRDAWSKPQAVIRIQAPNDDAFLTYWQENGKAIREWFVQEELARQIRFYRANTNKDARAKLTKQGYDMLVPEDYMLLMDTTLVVKDLMTNDQTVNVLWCCNNKGPMRKDIIVYNYRLIFDLRSCECLSFINCCVYRRRPVPGPAHERDLENDRCIASRTKIKEKDLFLIVSLQKLRVPAACRVPPGIFHKGVIGAKIHFHWFPVIRTVLFYLP